MANNINWGQGTSNNLIDWGQGAINNAISWGISYFTSWSGETDIIGSAAVILAKSFEVRVLADGGTIEAIACLTTTLTKLNRTI